MKSLTTSIGGRAFAGVLVAGVLSCAGSGEGSGDRSPSAPGPGVDDAGAPIDLTGVDNPVGGSGPSSAPPPSTGLPAPDCVAQSQVAREVPVDMYIMLDRSGSMLDLTSDDSTKWDSIRAAIESFVLDPDSEGLGVGLQYFPLKTPGVPERCTTDDDCGMPGDQCLTRACRPRPGPFQTAFTYCLNDTQCPFGSGGCDYFGVCSEAPTFACFDLGAGGCGTDGDCDPVEGLCLYYASCDVDDYTTPRIDIDVLPDNAMAIVDSLLMEEPLGATPTSVALVGAINGAANHQLDNPTHRAIAVLATDGLPTDCLPVDIASVADFAAQGTQLRNPISTYVIGVFAPNDLDAAANLDLIAEAGGTGEAFIVDTGEDTTQQFLDALSEIRGGTLACEFQLPDPPEGASLDFNRVNVTFAEQGNDPQDLFYVETPDGCAQASLGWFYDDNPDQGGTPTKIVVCPDTCDTLESTTTEGRVDIALGCETRRPD